jgi:hypothetical protein
MQKSKYILAGLFTGLATAVVILCLITNNRSVSTALADDTDKTPSWIKNITQVEPPTDVSLFGKAVPLDHWEVRERFEREFYYNLVNADQLVLWTKRLRRWEPMLDSALRANGLHQDFKYLMVAESGVRNVESPSKAHGFWQFIPPTAERYGLQVDQYVDERLDPRRSTGAAMIYLQKLKSQFGDELLAAASYNMGESGMTLALENQKQSRYWDLYVNEETMRYILRIAAIKELLENDLRYGYDFHSLPHYAPFRTKTVTAVGPIDVADWALSQGYTYKDVKIYNQWIINRKLPEGTYEIALPLAPEGRTTLQSSR